MTPRRTDTNQEGAALIVAVFVGIILVILGAMIMSVSMRETTQSHRQVRLAASTQAAEAGLDDYVAKLIENHDYATQQVHPAEPTRTSTSLGTTTAGGSAWTGGNDWTYAAGAPTTWRKLANGYEYSLKVISPVAANRSVKLQVTGRKPGANDSRTIEATIRPATPLDFQRIVEKNAAYASDAITDGKIYVGGNLSHPGIARANVYVEGNITTHPTLENGAKEFDHSNIRTQIKNPILFSQFAVSLTTVKSAAMASGLYLNDPGVKAWRLQFLASGQISVQACRGGGGSLLSYYALGTNTTPPLPITAGCDPAYNVPVPANGAVYAEQMAMVRGTVNGRVTVVTNEDMILEGPTTYVDGLDDTLGLIPKKSFQVAYYIDANTPGTYLEWWGSVLVMDTNLTWGAQTKGASGPPGLTGFKHHGSVTTPTTGNMSVIPNRTYTYDKNLQFLQPPYFPVLEDAYTIQGYREIVSAS